MRIVSPRASARFTLAADTTLPVIDVQTDAAGLHAWEWTIIWGTYRRRGQVRTTGNMLRISDLLPDLGGKLNVTAVSGYGSTAVRAAITLEIIGANPAAHDVDAYLATKPNSNGFSAILQHETHYRHFTSAGQPIRSFDGGYGICQLTSPTPTFEQCWSWKRNVDGGLALFADKVRAATTYLSQGGRAYSADQLTREAVARWNGGAYHVWDGSRWARNPDILCDTATGNIGWDMTDQNNANHTEAQLHSRDVSQYRAGRPRGANWIYSGVCYADAILP